jgi:hypothetical protein
MMKHTTTTTQFIRYVKYLLVFIVCINASLIIANANRSSNSHNNNNNALVEQEDTNTNRNKNDDNSSDNPKHMVTDVSIDANGDIDSVLVNVVNDNNNNHTKEPHENRRDQQQTSIPHPHGVIPHGCKLVMAPSSLRHPNSGWGIFSLVPITKGYPIMEGDVVIQINDINRTYVPKNDRLLTVVDHVFVHDYLWSSEGTGGYYEGKHVLSAIPGIGMLANGLSDKLHNVIPFVPNVDEGGLTRTDSPGSGAISHYHNYSFYASKHIEAGSELFVNYGTEWFQQHRDTIMTPSTTNHETLVDYNRLEAKEDTTNTRIHYTIDWLRQHGICLDNIKPNLSKQPHAGRGVFAKRYIPIHTIVAPAPVLVISRKEMMDITRINENGKVVTLKQLLLNYCYGHRHSSLLLFPYSPMVK